ncbi:hypothetical protein ELQ90_03870 [Labedella phragmitis]|uniref:Uncharacterized protein n=1 Tax=Labedella phragmitis TaxID=2498849 RepID=A0A444PZ56_9MICO|nr:hypothetical protein [Labedella phragmitis]RWZ53071.1 hypothetical protein ELQ90_03870 [Labedella phragmitis]
MVADTSHDETQDAPIMDGAKEEWAAKRVEDAEKGPGEHLGGSGGLSEHVGEDGDGGAPIYESRSTDHTTDHTDVRDAAVDDPIEAASLDQSRPGSEDSEPHEPARPGPAVEHSTDDGSLEGPDVETHTDPDIDPEPRQS